LSPLFALEITVHELELVVLGGVGLVDFKVLHPLREGCDSLGKLVILLILLS
jgi:hypothetical protein